MPVTIGTLCYRKPGLSREEFKDYFENTHVPLLMRLCCSENTDTSSNNVNVTPLGYRRNYMASTPTGAPFVLHGSAEKIDWDAFSELTFASMADFQGFAKNYAMNRQVINEDEKRFFDVDRILVAAYETSEGLGQ